MSTYIQLKGADVAVEEGIDSDDSGYIEQWMKDGVRVAGLATDGTWSGKIAVSGGVTSSSPTTGVGYAAGAGGAITQITDATTGVTLSKVTGQITTVALTTAAAAEERFTVTNTTVVATDVVVVSTTYAGAGTPIVGVIKVAAGAFDVVITNLHASAALNAAMVINFAVIKAVAA